MTKTTFFGVKKSTFLGGGSFFWAKKVLLGRVKKDFLWAKKCFWRGKTCLFGQKSVFGAKVFSQQWTCHKNFPFFCKKISDLGDCSPYEIFFSMYKGTNALYWPNNINSRLIVTQYRQVPTCCPILTKYTASSPRNVQLSQLDLVFYFSLSIECL